MAFPKRIDRNQNEIVKELRKMGVSVWITSASGKGSPDLVIGARGINLLVELKDGEKSASQRNLTPLEDVFHKLWQGQINIVNNMDEMKALLTQHGCVTL